MVHNPHFAKTPSTIAISHPKSYQKSPTTDNPNAMIMKPQSTTKLQIYAIIFIHLQVEKLIIWKISALTTMHCSPIVIMR